MFFLATRGRVHSMAHRGGQGKGVYGRLAIPHIGFFISLSLSLFLPPSISLFVCVYTRNMVLRSRCLNFSLCGFFLVVVFFGYVLVPLTALVDLVFLFGIFLYTLLQALELGLRIEA